jgi:hypothetical protein
VTPDFLIFSFKEWLTEQEQVAMTEHLQIFVDSLAAAHKDNSILVHFAKRPGRVERYSTMPVTPFVYQYFLYNSLYSVDWKQSVDRGCVCTLNGKEHKKQGRFEAFLRKKVEQDLTCLNALFPLTELPTDGNWTEVKADDRVSVDEGRAFFHDVKLLQDHVQAYQHSGSVELDKLFETIARCRKFTYKIRNNIFHGSKRLGDVWDKAQKKRIEVYYRFLNCLVSMFFMAVKDGKAL